MPAVKTILPALRNQQKQSVSFTYGNWGIMDTAYSQMGIDYESV